MAARAKSKHFEQGIAAFIMSEPQPRTYLDCNATAPMRPAVREAVLAQMMQPGNASSIHAEGRAARAAIEGARAEVGRLFAADADRVTFTSGATEAAALALTPDFAAAHDREPATRLLVGATEHPAVLQGHRFPADRVAVIPVRPDGVIDRDRLVGLLALPGRAIVAVQAANGETGVIQPIAPIAALVHEAGGLLVCDAVQAAGRVDVAGADAVLVSAHKLGGPQGVGALVMLGDGVLAGQPLWRGGGQERGLRSGTENGPAIVGFGIAARLVAAETDGTLALRQRLEAGLLRIAPDLVIFGDQAPRLPNTTAFAVPGIANETALIALDLAGFALSTGSACSSGKVSRSAVLEAMGVDAHLSKGMLRISFGWSSTAADVDRFVEAFGVVVQRMRDRPARAAA